MEKIVLLVMLVVLLWFALRVAKFVMKLAFIAAIILLVVGYYMYMR